MQACTTILIEHCSLDAVIHGMLYLVRDIRRGAKPNFELFDAMVHYIIAFPELPTIPRRTPTSSSGFANGFRTRNRCSIDSKPITEKARKRSAISNKRS